METRREFLTKAGVSMGLAVTAGARASDRPAAFPARVLGKTGLKVPILEVGGTYRFNRRYVQRALDLGLTFFDTAASYVNGWSERTLGEAVRGLGVRKQITVVTKGHPRRPEQLEAEVNASLERLGFDAIDVYYLHNLKDVAVVTDRAWRQAAEALKKSGKIKFFGFSNHNENAVPLLNAAGKGGFVDVIMVKYNFRSYGDKELGAALDAAHRAGIGLIAMKTQGAAVSFIERVDPFQKAGFSKHQAVLKAVWKDERLASAVSCMPSIQVLEQNAAAANEKLSRAEAELLERYAAATRAQYCPGGCGGCRRECESATGGRLAIADSLRYLMYHQSYGRRPEARAKFQRLDGDSKAWSDKDLRIAEAACPQGLPLTELLPRANRILS